MNWLLVPVFVFILGLWLFVTGAILYGVGGDHPGLLIAGVVAVGAFVTSLFIRLHAIPIAGSMGLVFALGFAAMFWFGLPGLRPVVLVTGGMGIVLGALLSWLSRRRAARGGSR